MRHRFAAAGLALCMTAAAPAPSYAFLDSLKKTLGGDQSEERDSTRLDELVSSGASRSSCGGDGHVSRLNAAVEQGLGIVDNKALSSYLQGVLAKLVAVSPYPGCKVTVYVTPHDAAQAVALADGGILVALGFLRNLKNEDEVAALLGHEVSHILLDHHSSDSFVDTQDSFLKGLEAANASGGMLLGFVDPSLQQGVDAAVSVGGAVYNISETMIAPAWTVEQEDEADLLGTDLLAAAGYNPRAMASVMDVIKAQEVNAAKVEAQRDEIYKKRVQGSVISALTTTNVNDTVSIVGSVASLTSALVSGGDKRTHRPAEERKASVNAYIKKFYNKYRRRPFETAAWATRQSKGDSGRMFDHYYKATVARRAVFTGGDLKTALKDANASVAGTFSDDAYPRLAQSEVRLKDGDRKAALASLKKVMQGGHAPWQIYRSYADLQLASGNVPAAAQAVETADQRFGQPLGIAPFAIKVYRAANDEARVQYYLDRCNKNGSREHVKICRHAAGLEPESQGGGSGGIGGFMGGIFSGAGSGGKSLPLGPSPDSESQD